MIILNTSHLSLLEQVLALLMFASSTSASHVAFKFCLKIFSLPGQSPGRAIVLPSALALGSVLASVSALALAKCLSFNVKVFYVMGKALSGELSCPCERSCYMMDKVLLGELQVHEHIYSFNFRT